ncbi:Intergrase/Recombinase [Methanococcoides vulcani]|uniref:Intergrase/Recombinase n=1 Tax=Methanococcoides vulcani TaxID=1353158 RepID=A0A1H9Y2V0_9EURY|nr:integrase [Methanococcoides vulcani]SES63126.1 Intergrase/Recombinase [Methanococcoides vulcani]
MFVISLDENFDGDIKVIQKTDNSDLETRVASLEQQLKSLSETHATAGIRTRVLSLGSSSKTRSVDSFNSSKMVSVGVPKIDYTSIKIDFEKWVYNRIGEPTAKSYIRYLDRYLKGVVIENIEDLINISTTVNKGWNSFAKSIRNLINYSIEKRLISKEWGIELKEVLKIKKNGTDTFVPKDETVRAVLDKCDKEEMKLLMQLIYYSGIRIIEAIKILTEFDDKKLHYEEGVAYYDLDWERGNKKAFKAFMPTDFAGQLMKVNINEGYARRYIRERGLPLKYGRNFFIDKCVKAGIQESLIKYMVGHSNGSVLMTNYLDKLNNSTLNYKKVIPSLMEIIAI